MIMDIFPLFCYLHLFSKKKRLCGMIRSYYKIYDQIEIGLVSLYLILVFLKGKKILSSRHAQLVHHLF